MNIKPIYVILLVIISNNILVNLSIIFTYHLIFIGLLFQYIKFYLSIPRNYFSYIALLRSALAII